MGNFRKLSWTDADVRCPFYVTDSRAECSIRCEGYEAGMDTLSRFRSISQRDRHMGRYCVARFEDCPLYRCTYDSKYADA